eukprot:CAMPEP_0183737462 /NCGR_PEP_ID=MMETSP0737-20130205/52073_1 /TAXON_ID=385413 /ORGANISM="Thalassiosira miniscula, Strain CCMP1093" /LENGTH=337 /DNA_ID=CAMNT_0025971747 /DNA_START=141 /DNA_END=1154 /DNA_ORIENTATION=+
MVPSAEQRFGGSSRSTQRGVNHVTEVQASRDLLYDQLRNMMTQENRGGYKCCDYLSYYSPQSEKPRASRGIDVGCRASICSWMYRVADHFSIDREVVSIALSYIDRILSTNHCADRRTFKLISATSFHLAIKVHFPHIGQEVGFLLPDLSRGDFALDDIIEMEKELVDSLTWLLNPVSPQSIAMHILTLLPFGVPRNIVDTSLFLAELSVCDYFFVTVRKSIVAIAAVMNACESAGCMCFESPRDAFGISHHDLLTQIEKILLDIGYGVDWRELSSARERLWSLYRQSNELEPPQDAEPPSTPRKSTHDSSPHFVQDNLSPTSCSGVRTHGFSNHAL